MRCEREELSEKRRLGGGSDEHTRSKLHVISPAMTVLVRPMRRRMEAVNFMLAG